MGNAILSHSENSSYNDELAQLYHFPKIYLNQVAQALNDWIIYYEPRRDDGPSSSKGRQAYFAMARLVEVFPDPASEKHYYARLEEYIEFDRVVPFRDESRYYESSAREIRRLYVQGSFWSIGSDTPLHRVRYHCRNRIFESLGSVGTHRE